jgi:RNA-binding protein YlmH
MVRSGLVELEYRQTDNVSAEVKEGMILSVRGFGKYVIGPVSGTTKSGRIRISCKKYI